MESLGIKYLTVLCELRKYGKILVSLREKLIHWVPLVTRPVSGRSSSRTSAPTALSPQRRLKQTRL